MSFYEDEEKLETNLETPFDKVQVRQTQLALWTSNVNILRKEGVFTDVVIVCGVKEIHAHRVVLSASSPFFSAMLQSSMTEASTGRIQLKVLDPGAVEVVVSFLYTGDIMPIEDDTALARAVLEAAHMLQITVLFEYSLRVLRSKLSSVFFFDLLEVAELYDLPYLERDVYFNVAYQLEQACCTEDFHRLNLHHIQKVLSHPVLSATTLDVIVEAVVQWTRVDAVARLPGFVTVLSRFDLRQLSAEFIKKLLKSEDIIEKDGIISNLLEVSAAQYAGWTSYKNCQLRTTTTLICYGKSRSHESLFSIFDCTTNCFRAPTPLSSSVPEDATAVAYNNIIYFIGGVNETGMTSAVLRFYPLVKAVVNFSNLLHKVSDAAAVSFLEKIYVVGGFDVYKRHSKVVQCLDPVSGICKELAPTSKLHRYPYVGHIAEHIYVVGTKLNDQHIERYSPTANQWTVVSTIPHLVCGCGGTFGKRVMYCVPDCNTPSEMWSCNPSTLVWKKNFLNQSPTSFQGRWTVSTYSADEYVLFVTDDDETIYCYLPGNDTWIRLPVAESTTERNGPPSMMCIMGFCVV